VLTDNGPNGFLMVLHPSGKRILGENNIAFIHGPGHKALRNSFLPLFTRKVRARARGVVVVAGGQGGRAAHPLLVLRSHSLSLTHTRALVPPPPRFLPPARPPAGPVDVPQHPGGPDPRAH
jgi:hypothetical protein